MAKANFVKSARKPIYRIGKGIEYISKKGKREGQTLSKVDRSQPANENDQILVNIGESYWWWEFKGGSTHISKVNIKSQYQRSISKVNIKGQYQRSISEVNIKSQYQKSKFIVQKSKPYIFLYSVYGFKKSKSKKSNCLII